MCWDNAPAESFLATLKKALVIDPWVTSRCGSAGEGRAEPAEVEHGEGDKRFG